MLNSTTANDNTDLSGVLLTLPADLATFYLVLTAANEIYDDFGEDISPEKIKNAVYGKHLQVTKYEEGQTEDDVIFDYQTNPCSRSASLALLVNLKSSSAGFNKHSFFVSSYSMFKVELDEDKQFRPQ